MNRKLTAKQVKELVAYHKKPDAKQGAVELKSMGFMDLEEAEKQLPGIVTHYTVKRPPTNRSSKR